MIEMINNSIYESENNFRLVKRKYSTEKIWTVKKMSVSRKYIAKMFGLKRLLVSECILKLVCLCESCKESESGLCFTEMYSLKNLWTDCGIGMLYLHIFFYSSAWNRYNWRGVFRTLSKHIWLRFFAKIVNGFWLLTRIKVLS